MKKKLKRKNRSKRLFSILLIITILAIFGFYIFNLKVKNIVILNSNYYSDEKIIETAQVEDYPKFILLSKSKIKNKLSSLKLIDSVSVKKKFGCILEIDITEKKVLFYNRSDNNYTLSDGKSYDLENIIGVPTLINFVPEDIKSNFIKKFSDVDSNIISMISEIEYSKSSYDSNRFLLYMNDGNEVYITISKIKNLNKYIDIVKKLDNKKGILYLDSGNYFSIKSK